MILSRFRESCDRLYTAERGSAIVEFVFVAILVFVPLVYLMVTIASIERSRVAVTDAARSVGRALATSTSASDAENRADVALRLVLDRYGWSPHDVQLRVVDEASTCRATPSPPELFPGGVFAVCVSRVDQLPGVPTVVSGSAINTVGRYVVHMDDFRTLAP